MSQNKIVLVLVAAVVILGGVYFFSHKSVNPMAGAVDCSNGSTTCFTNIGATGTLSVDGASTLTGAVTFSANPVFSGSGVSFNGVSYAFPKSSFTAATTTPCSLLSPAATSTLLVYNSKITVGTSTAATFDVGTSTTPYATTTLNFIQQRVVASGAQDYVYFTGTTTSPTGVTNQTISPSTYVVFKTGTVAGGYTFTGSCSAIFAY